MKHTYIILLISLSISACSKSFIDTTPTSEKSAEGFFRTEKDFDQAVTGVYDGLQGAYKSYFEQMMNEERSDNHFGYSLTSSYDDNSVSNFTVSASAPFLNDAWASLYNIIQRCNKVLDKIDGVAFSVPAKKDQYIGEMKFIRALSYFDLVRYFGDVPLVTTTLTTKEALVIPRSTTGDVYNQIIDDLEDAISKLPETYTNANVGRASKYSAEGLLGKIYLTRSGYPLKTNEWSKAKDLFKDIITSGRFKFLDNYEDIFSLANENGPQCLFYIQFKAGVTGEGNPIPTISADNDINTGLFLFGGDPGGIKVSQELIDSYEPNDKRFTHDIRLEWIDKSGALIKNRPGSKKFESGVPANRADWDINMPVIRYTDILMMYAECLNELGYEPNGEAIAILNQVRVRAGLSPKTSADIPDQSTFRLAMENERRHEFAFENIRWNDLVRTDRALDVMHDFLSHYGMSANLKSRDQYIYPIPLIVLQVSPTIKQNPGY